MNRFTDKELRILGKAELECSDVTVLLGSYVDNDLSPSLRERIKTHVRCCEKCQHGEFHYREVIRLARELPPIEVSDEIKNRLRQALNKRLGINIPVY